MTHLFNIDMDAACPQCGKGGSVNGGLCTKCADKKIKQAIETQISYVVEKVSDKQSVFVDENQPALFPVTGEKLVVNE